MLRTFAPTPTLIRLPAALAAVALALAVGIAPAGAQTPTVTKASTAAAVTPIAVNAPGGAVADLPPPKPGDGAAPFAPDAPRVGPPPGGQLVAEDYRIGAQDLIEIQVFGIDDLKREVRVNSRGIVSLPLIGAVTIAGLTGQEAEALIAAKYAKDYLQDPQVSVFIKEFTSQRITVEGAVNHPGIFPVRGPTSLLQAIALAGGQGQLSDMSEVMVYRVESGQKKTLMYNVIKIRGGEVQDPMLANDDVVVVKRSGDRVAVRDSIFGDIINLVNPFNYIRPY